MKSGRSSAVRVFGAALLVIAILVAADVYLPAAPKADVLPSFEGLHFAFIGLQPPNTSIVYVGNSNATQLCLANGQQCAGFVQSVGDNGVVASQNGGNDVYSWQYGQTQALVKYCHKSFSFASAACVSINIDPATQQQSLVQSISYKTRVTPTSGFNVLGNIYDTPGQLALSVPTQSSNVNVQFQNVILWFAAYASGYNNAQEGGPVDGASWTTPILNEFEGAPTPPGQGGTVANNYGTNPGTNSGIEPVALYSIPQTSSSFGGVLTSPSGTAQVNQSLAYSSVDAPDSRMLPYGFFPVVLTNFGSYACGFLGTSECDNTIQLDWSFYTLQMGTSAWTNPITQSQTTQQGNCSGGCSNPLKGLGDWLSNPLNLGFLVSLAVILLIVVFAPELFIIPLTLLMGRRRR